jgi:hypothetical protein
MDIPETGVMRVRVLYDQHGAAFNGAMRAR